MSLSNEFDYDRDTNVRGSINNNRLRKFNISCSRHQKKKKITNQLQINSPEMPYAVFEATCQYECV